MIKYRLYKGISWLIIRVFMQQKRNRIVVQVTCYSYQWLGPRGSSGFHLSLIFYFCSRQYVDSSLVYSFSFKKKKQFGYPRSIERLRLISKNVVQSMDRDSLRIFKWDVRQVYIRDHKVKFNGVHSNPDCLAILKSAYH